MRPELYGTVVSDVGRLRPNNEDNFLLGQQVNGNCVNKIALAMALPRENAGWHLAGVFDGMGGGERGELAALTAAECFREAAKLLLTAAEAPAADDILRGAFCEANDRILPLREQLGVFGTTGTLACVGAGRMKLYHLGDSRCYLLRRGTLTRLTRDHTLAQLKVNAGLFRPDDPALEPDRHKLTEFIGVEDSGAPLRPEESQWIPLMIGDCVLLCSDGLYDRMSEREILEIMTACPDHRHRAGRLTARAVERGGRDNVTCVCLDYMDIGRGRDVRHPGN